MHSNRFPCGGKASDNRAFVIWLLLPSHSIGNKPICILITVGRSIIHCEMNCFRIIRSTFRCVINLPLSVPMPLPDPPNAQFVLFDSGLVSLIAHCFENGFSLKLESHTPHRFPFASVVRFSWMVCALDTWLRAQTTRKAKTVPIAFAPSHGPGLSFLEGRKRCQGFACYVSSRRPLKTHQWPFGVHGWHTIECAIGGNFC